MDRLHHLAHDVPNIEFLGFRSREEVMELYRGAIAVLLPSRVHENFPLMVLEALASGKPLTIYGTGAQRRDYVYVEDVARAFLAAALTPGTEGHAYNVGSGVGTSFREMVELLAGAIPGAVVKSVPWPSERLLLETGDFVADIRALRAATGWAPTVPLPEGIQRTIAYYREHWDHYVKAEVEAR